MNFLITSNNKFLYDCHIRRNEFVHFFTSLIKISSHWSQISISIHYNQDTLHDDGFRVENLLKMYFFYYINADNEIIFCESATQSNLINMKSTVSFKSICFARSHNIEKIKFFFYHLRVANW